MTTLTVISRDGEERTIVASVGHSVMEAIRDSGFGDILALCGGNCACATCHIQVEPADFSRLPEMASNECDLLDCAPNRTRTSRLACQILWVDALNGLRVRIAPDE